VKVVNEPTFVSSNIAAFTVGAPGSFAISASEGNIALVGTLPHGLSFAGGNPARITGTAAAGTGGQYQYDMTLTDPLGTPVTIYQSLKLNVYEAPTILSPSKATFPTGLPGSFAVTTTGFPGVSSQPLMPPLTPPTSPNQGKGMYFTVTGLPASLRASNLDPQGFATGTLTIQGTPLPGDAGSRLVQVTARNGVGITAQQTLTLNIVKLGERLGFRYRVQRRVHRHLPGGRYGHDGPELHVCRRGRKRSGHGVRRGFHTLRRKRNRQGHDHGIV
jgi:hypothetical protein